MTVSDRIRLTAQIAALKEVAVDYQGKTIDNIIKQVELYINKIIRLDYTLLALIFCVIS